MLQISYAGCLGLSPSSSKSVAAAEKSKKVAKTFYIKGLKSFKVVNVDTS